MTTTDPRFFSSKPWDNAPSHRAEPPESTPAEIFQPRSALWWLMVICLGLGGVSITLSVSDSFNAAMGPMLAILPMVLVTILVLGALILLLDRYRGRRIWPMLLGTLLGATTATAVSIKGNGAIGGILVPLLGEDAAADWDPAFSGPVTEEWSKMLCALLVILLAAKTVRRPMQGFLVGAFTGMGFQIFENVSYFVNTGLDNANDTFMGGFTTLLLRTGLAVTSHWLWTGFIGIGLAILLGRTGAKHWSMGARILAMVGFYALSFGLHFWWNSPAGDSGMMALLMFPIKIAVNLLILVFVLRWLWKQERLALAPADAQVSDEALAQAYGHDAAEVRAAVGNRKTRKTAKKGVRKAGGRKAVKALKKDWKDYLLRLQPMAARGE